jgi:hypothetical protein
VRVRRTAYFYQCDVCSLAHYSGERQRATGPIYLSTCPDGWARLEVTRAVAVVGTHHATQVTRCLDLCPSCATKFEAACNPELFRLQWGV